MAEVRFPTNFSELSTILGTHSILVDDGSDNKFATLANVKNYITGSINTWTAAQTIEYSSDSTLTLSVVKNSSNGSSALAVARVRNDVDVEGRWIVGSSTNVGAIGGSLTRQNTVEISASGTGLQAMVIGTITAGAPISFVTGGNTERMRLLDAGLSIGASALVGSEKLRVAGGSAATAGATDVCIGAGVISVGATDGLRIGATSIFARANTWTAAQKFQVAAGDVSATFGDTSNTIDSDQTVTIGVAGTARWGLLKWRRSGADYFGIGMPSSSGDVLYVRDVVGSVNVLTLNRATYLSTLAYSFAIGATALVGSERLRVAGGSATTAGATDVCIGAGVISVGATDGLRIGATSIFARANTWTAAQLIDGVTFTIQRNTSNAQFRLIRTGTSTADRWIYVNTDRILFGADNGSGTGPSAVVDFSIGSSLVWVPSTSAMAVGATVLVGSEKLRVAGGTATTAGATDVCIGAGVISVGATDGLRIGATSIFARANTWTNTNTISHYSDSQVVFTTHIKKSSGGTQQYSANWIANSTGTYYLLQFLDPSDAFYDNVFYYSYTNKRVGIRDTSPDNALSVGGSFDTSDNIYAGAAAGVGSERFRAAGGSAVTAGATDVCIGAGVISIGATDGLRIGATSIFARANSWSANQTIAANYALIIADGTSPLQLNGGSTSFASEGGLFLGIARAAAGAYYMTLAGSGATSSLIGGGVTTDAYRRVRITMDGEFYHGIGSSVSVSTMKLLSGSVAVGATALVGSERLRVAGGSAATAGATDVCIGAGVLSVGATDGLRIGATSIFARENTWSETQTFSKKIILGSGVNIEGGPDAVGFSIYNYFTTYYLYLCGGLNGVSGARIILYGTDHSTNSDEIIHYADYHIFNNQINTVQFMAINSSNLSVRSTINLIVENTTDAASVTDTSAALHIEGGASIEKTLWASTIKTNNKITAVAAVPGSFADLAAVRTYLASILT